MAIPMIFGTSLVHKQKKNQAISFSFFTVKLFLFFFLKGDFIFNIPGYWINLTFRITVINIVLVGMKATVNK
jgi:hypothetical protein